MTNDSVIDAVVREFADFYLEDVDDEQAESYENYCQYAQILHHWTLEMLQQYVRTNPSPVRLAQSKVLLQDRFFAMRMSVPKSHRNRIGENGHVCIFQVYEQTYQKILLVELTLTPPQLFTPPPPPPPPKALTYGGITLGEVLGEE